MNLSACFHSSHNTIGGSLFFSLDSSSQIDLFLESNQKTLACFSAMWNMFFKFHVFALTVQRWVLNSTYLQYQWLLYILQHTITIYPLYMEEKKSLVTNSYICVEASVRTCQSKESGSHIAMMLALIVLTSGHSDASCGNHEALCALCHDERIGRMIQP